MILRDTTISVVCDEIEHAEHPKCYGFAMVSGTRTSECLERLRNSGWDVDLKASRAVCPLCSKLTLHRGAKSGDRNA